MSMITLAECARLLSATMHPSNTSNDGVFESVSTDSRSVGAGQLFVALVGENFDGHDYVASAAVHGATAALVSRLVDTADTPITQILVGDTMWAYGKLAQHWRSRSSCLILALTGSNGKTTVKEMLRSILEVHIGDANKIHVTEGNLNNNIGVPQMLLGLSHSHRLAVFELGMNHLQEIDYLTRLVIPDVALIIMAGTAHIGELGSRQTIAQAKGEIFSGLSDDGIAVINIDDDYSRYWRGVVGSKNKRKIISFGLRHDAAVRGTLGPDPLTGEPSTLAITIAGETANIKLKVIGEHNQRNAIAAAAGAHALGVGLATIAAGLASFTGVAGRLRTYAGLQGATVIDDTYNANPDSMRAAIAVLAATHGKKILVLGDMGELGKDAEKMHHEIGAAARQANIDALYGMGALANFYVDAFGLDATHYMNAEELIAGLTASLDANTTVLVKGSRFMQMERVVRKIAPEYSAQHKDAH